MEAGLALREVQNGFSLNLSENGIWKGRKVKYRMLFPSSKLCLVVPGGPGRLGLAAWWSLILLRFSLPMWCFGLVGLGWAGWLNWVIHFCLDSEFMTFSPSNPISFSSARFCYCSFSFWLLIFWDVIRLFGLVSMSVVSLEGVCELVFQSNAPEPIYSLWPQEDLAMIPRFVLCMQSQNGEGSLRLILMLRIADMSRWLESSSVGNKMYVIFRVSEVGVGRIG
jgi:hypothetical protein